MFLSCAQNGQILFWEQRSPIERDLVWLDSIIARVARHSVRMFAWLANFVLWLSLIFLLYGLRWATLISSGLTILISLDFFPLFWTNIPADEGGVGRAVLQPLEIGAWLWFSSIAAAFVCAWILFLAPRKGVQGAVGLERQSQSRMDPPSNH